MNLDKSFNDFVEVIKLSFKGLFSLLLSSFLMFFSKNRIIEVMRQEVFIKRLVISNLIVIFSFSTLFLLFFYLKEKNINSISNTIFFEVQFSIISYFLVCMIMFILLQYLLTFMNKNFKDDFYNIIKACFILNLSYITLLEIVFFPLTLFFNSEELIIIGTLSLLILVFLYFITILRIIFSTVNLSIKNLFVSIIILLPLFFVKFLLVQIFILVGISSYYLVEGLN